jgi:hypothetical protein
MASETDPVLATSATTMRKMPEPLYNCVLELSLRIANAAEAEDPRARRGAYRRLRTLYRTRLGKPDPFLTETLADFTTGPRTAAKLYRLAIQQCAEFPDEGLYTKQIVLARVLTEIGNAPEAATLLSTATPAASAQDDASALAEIDELLATLREPAAPTS